MPSRSRRWWYLLLLVVPAGIAVASLAWPMSSVPPRDGPLTAAHVDALDQMAASGLEPFGSHDALADYLAPFLEPPPGDDPDQVPEWLTDDAPPTTASQRHRAVASPRHERPPEMDGVRVGAHFVLLHQGRLHSVALEDPPRLVDTLSLGALTPAQHRVLWVAGRTVVSGTRADADMTLRPVDVDDDGRLSARPALYLSHGLGTHAVGGERYLVGTSYLPREQLSTLGSASLPATRSAPADPWSPLLGYDEVLRPALALDAPDLVFVIICDVSEPLRCRAHGLISQGIPAYPFVVGRTAAWLHVTESDRVATARDPDAPPRALLLRFPFDADAPGAVRANGRLLALREHSGGAWLALSGAPTTGYSSAPPPLQVVDVTVSQLAQSQLGVVSPDPARVFRGHVDWPVGATLTATHAIFYQVGQAMSIQSEADGILVALASSEAPASFHLDQGVSSVLPLGEADFLVRHVTDKNAFWSAARVTAVQGSAPRVVQHEDSFHGWPSSPCAGGRVVHGSEALPMVAYAHEGELTVVRLDPAGAQVLGHWQVPPVRGSRPACIPAMVDERLHFAVGDTVRSFRFDEAGALVETGLLSVSDSTTERPDPTDSEQP